VDDPPLALTDGGLIARGRVDPELDELDRAVAGRRARWCPGSRSGASGHRHQLAQDPPEPVFGLFIEVSTANLHRVPSRFLRADVVELVERYRPRAAGARAPKVLAATSAASQLELELFTPLRERVSQAVRACSSWRARAGRRSTRSPRWPRWRCERRVVSARDLRRLPVIWRSDAARHPVVEAACAEERFVPNDVRLDPGHAAVASC
jgi:DNA mismatch repair ATPase MutS